jgi:hypothetical protein
MCRARSGASLLVMPRQIVTTELAHLTDAGPAERRRVAPRIGERLGALLDRAAGRLIAAQGAPPVVPLVAMGRR